jgi:16S rRNA (guanine527-N7)-methyltransferase
MRESRTEQELLAAGAQALGFALDSKQVEILVRYLDLLYFWNRSAGLTAIARPDAVRLHLLDSLLALPLPASDTCADLGTGAGLPGIVLAVTDPQRRFTLVETNRRKCSFLMEAVRSLDLSNVEVVERDADHLVADGRRFPLVVSRAFRSPLAFLRTAAGLLERGGQAVSMLANPSESEVAALVADSGLVLLEERRSLLPGGGEPRTILVLGFPG